MQPIPLVEIYNRSSELVSKLKSVSEVRNAFPTSDSFKDISKSNNFQLTLTVISRYKVWEVKDEAEARFERFVKVPGTIKYSKLGRLICAVEKVYNTIKAG